MSELSEATLLQLAKGYIVGSTLFFAINHGRSLDEMLNLIKAPPGSVRQAWLEMHSVAHLWAAAFELKLPHETMAAPLELLPADQLKPLLVSAEGYLERMQSRPDLRHPDPWRCSPELRQSLGLPPEPTGSA